MSVSFPTDLDGVAAATGQIRAGGTDVHDLRRHQPGGDLVDLRDVPDLDRIEVSEEGIRIGAGVRVAALAAHPTIQEGFPGLAAAAGGLATPAIRNVATVGGNLLQANRCWYHRHPDFPCFRKGGMTCFARGGDSHWHSVIDKGPCIAPHASTLAVALHCWDARVDVHGQVARRSLDELYGPGANPSVDHLLKPGEVLTGVWLQPPGPDERSAWLRVSNRVRAEWPLVEAVIRLRLEGDAIRGAWIALGGVANIPLRLPAVEAWLVDKVASPDTLREAGRQATAGLHPLPGAAHKVPLIEACVAQTLALALERPA